MKRAVSLQVVLEAELRALTAKTAGMITRGKQQLRVGLPQHPYKRKVSREEPNVLKRRITTTLYNTALDITR